MKKPPSNTTKTNNSFLQPSRVLNAFRWRFRRLWNICIFGKVSSIPCNICKGRIFIRGPYGRLSNTGQLPWCSKCWSLERHRALREFWKRFPRDYLAQQVALQFSDDPSVDQKWFRNFTLSIYSLQNSLDLQDIDRPNASYDITLCNQVLEHVPDDRKSLHELLRITKKNGFVQLGVPSPMTLEKTEDWGYPKKEDNNHYRNYGRDINQMLDELIGVGNWREFVITDPVTKAQDCIFLLCHSAATLVKIIDLLEEKRMEDESRLYNAKKL